jgi:hypothetical protein
MVLIAQLSAMHGDVHLEVCNVSRSFRNCVQILQLSHLITLIWVPGHMRIKANETADAALNRSLVRDPTPTRDISSCIHMSFCTGDSVACSDGKLTPACEAMHGVRFLYVVIEMKGLHTRMRIGHCHLTQVTCYRDNTL